MKKNSKLTAREIKKETAGLSLDPERARLQEQTTAMNEQLIVSSMHQHELTEVAGKLNKQLQTEITERRKTEEALRKSEGKYRTLFDSIDEGFCIIEKVKGEADEPLDFRYVEANPAFAVQSGVRGVVGKTIRQMFPGITEEWYETYDAILRTGEPIRFERRLATQGRMLELYAFRIEDDTHRRVAVIFKDITKRKQAEEALRASADRFRFLAESMPQKIFTAKPNGDLDYFNRQWTEFTGLTFEQIRDWGWLQFIHPEDVAENIRRWQDSIDTREPFYMEHRVLRIDGEYRWHVSRAVPMLDAEGKTLMWIGSNTDIEEIRQAREKAERAVRAKDEFLAALSHELRTPLTPVLMSVAALQQDNRLPQEVRDQLSMMKRNIELEARLIDDLLDLTRIAHGKLLLRTQPCDVHSLIALGVEMVRSDAQGKRQTMEIDLAAERSHVTGDPARLQQVFWNLLKNAVKFTPESGRLSVRSRDMEDRLAVEISDSGIGISPETIERIFLPFEQAGAVSADHRVPGLGLGLSIARAILDLHGGSIRAESGGLGQGATFRVELPATETPLGAILESISQSSGDARVHRAKAAPLRLLLVEDHQSTLDVLAHLLTRAGHRVTTAITVSGALKLAGADRFDAVISDLGLPDGTGFELMEKLRAAHGLCGIALSGYGMDEDLRRSHEAGFAAHLTKPIDFGQLEVALAEVVARAVPA
ncbi:MAG: ATP-binding protein [Chthoniobacterales bacterium]